jgi:predicted DsbA family dithiol-disulfide isomerase
LIVHDFVAKGHLGGCAASKQNKFNEYRHAWWETAWTAYASSRGDKNKLGDESIDKIASDLHLDMTKFKADINAADCNQRIQTDMAELQKWHVNSTPSFFVNGVHFGWDGDPHSFKAAIDEKLKVVEASGVKCAEYYEKEVMEKGEKKFRSMKEPKPN